MKPNEFKCALCKEIFEKARSDEAAIRECEEVWGEKPAKHYDVVCDDCWQTIHPSKFPLIKAQSIEETSTLPK